MKLALFPFNKQAILQDALQDLSDMAYVIRERVGEDEDVIKLHKHKTIDEISEDKTLKNRRSIS